MQYKSNQELSEEMRQKIAMFEEQNPTLFEELAMKRKWTNVAKDPTRAMKDSF